MHAKGFTWHYHSCIDSYDTIHILISMTSDSHFVVNLRGYDIYYNNGCFTLDPLPDVMTLQNIVSYLINEGFINVDEDF